MKRCRLLLALGLALLCAAGVLPVAAQDETFDPEALAINNPWLQLFPELRRLPAPAWLVEGTRTTYYVQQALVGGDPDDPGVSGAVLIQYDLVALDRRNALFNTTMYLENGAGGLTPKLVVGSRTGPAAGEYYLNPDVLANAGGVANEDLTAVSMPTTIGEREYQAVRFQYEQPRATYVWMYDEVTGILLFYRHEIETADGDQLLDMTLVHSRTLDLPWQADAAPEWAARGLDFRMEGNLATAVAGASAANLPQSAVGTITRTGARWSQYSVGASPGELAQASITRVSGVAQLTDALWLPAEALALRYRNRVIDSDPITGAQVTFSRRSSSVEINESGNGWSTTWYYNLRTGALGGFEQSTQIGLATLTLSMEMVEMDD